MTISVCIGSSCHVKRSSDIIALLRAAIKSNNLEDKIELKGTTCLGHCGSGGANLKVEDEIVEGLTKDNFDEFFKEKVLSKLN
ncbi:MAG: (2Fe-2S) ferredoxin domain-containing protein [Spirochaetaceae bacterium]|nr:(2Fe-2S) ferredoxin domain-containing protein [Spirochaetaceae bacterium]MBR4011574.1 (2Fe-2S) ferredoxin domain-containing protein [Spirochaetaceae bacterium]